MSNRSIFAAFVATLFVSSFIPLQADTEVPAPEAQVQPEPEAAAPVVEAAAPAPDVAVADTEPVAADETAKVALPPEPVKSASRKSKSRTQISDSFVAPSDWEFDGFVAGGRDQEVKTMFHLNDVVYLNIGGEDGLSTGDRVQFFKRGHKVRDPQSRKFIGYEVRRVATGLVTDRINGGTCSVRIMASNEGVEVGDLVRRNE